MNHSKSILALAGLLISTSMSSIAPAQVIGEICDANGCRSDYRPEDRPPRYPDPGRGGERERERDPRRPEYPRYPDNPPRYPDPGYPGNPDRPPRYPDNPPRYPDPGYPGNPISNYEIRVGRQMINEYITLNSYLPRGMDVSRVTVYARTSSNRSLVKLWVNNSVVDNQYGVAGANFLQLPYSVRVGSGDTLYVEVDGAMFVDTIIVEGGRGGGGYYPPDQGRFIELRAFPNVYLQGNNLLDLARYVDLYSYRGYRVNSVLVRGYSDRGFGTVALLADGLASGEVTMPRQSTEQIFTLSGRNVIGRDLGSLQLQTRGSLTIESIIVRVEAR